MSYPIQFKGAILEENGRPLVLDQVVFAGPLLPGQVLVRVQYSGICFKQIEEIRGSTKPDPFLPHLLGHEGSGIVVEVGPGVTKVESGDHVVLHWLKGAGIDAPTPQYTWKGRKLNAGWITTFNEYGVISENRLTRIPARVDLKVSCLLGCAALTGVGVIFNDARVYPADSVAVWGCGGVGLNAIQAAAIVGAAPIIAVDVNSESLDLARRFGATHAVNAGQEEAAGKVREITDGGAQHVIVAVSGKEAVQAAIGASSVPGSVLLVGVPPMGSEITVDAFTIHMGRSLRGSCGGGAHPDRDIPAYLALYEQDKLKLDELISKVVSLDDINDGIELMLSGKIGRCIVEMD